MGEKMLDNCHDNNALSKFMAVEIGKLPNRQAQIININGDYVIE